MMINTKLPPILHRFQITVKFSLARGKCLTLTLSLRVIPANIAENDIHVSLTRCSAIADRPRCRVRYSFPPKVEDWNWETIFYGQYRSAVI